MNIKILWFRLTLTRCPNMPPSASEQKIKLNAQCITSSCIIFTCVTVQFCVCELIHFILALCYTPYGYYSVLRLAINENQFDSIKILWFNFQHNMSAWILISIFNWFHPVFFFFYSLLINRSTTTKKIYLEIFWAHSHRPPLLPTKNTVCTF